MASPRSRSVSLGAHRQPGSRLDPIDAWIAAHPFDPDDARVRERAARESRIGWRRGDALGAYCVNRALFEQLHAIEGSAPLRDVPVDLHAAKRVRFRVARTVDAWLSAWRDYEAGHRASPAFAILDLGTDP